MRKAKTKIDKKDKIPVFIISGKSPLGASGGGYSSYAFNLAKIIKSLGHPVYILALSDEDRTVTTIAGKLLLFKAKIPFLNVNINALPGLPYYSIIFAKGINKIAKQRGYKKIIVWGIGPWGFAGTLLKFSLGKKVIHLNNYFTTIRHEWWGGVKALRIKDYGIWPKLRYLVIYSTVVQYLALIEKLLLKHVDKIITNYRSTEDILNKEFKINRKKFLRTHSFVQIFKRSVKDAKKIKGSKTPSRYVFYFSRQDPRKGVNYLLHAIKILTTQGKGVPLLIAGKGDMLEYNKKLSKKLGIEKYVKFLGFVNDPKKLMDDCTLFVFPSVEEGSSALTIHEAMQAGLPIISTACDGIPEDIEDGKSGILVPSENSEELADAIYKLWTDKSLAVKLGKNAKQQYMKKFNFETTKSELKTLLSKL